MALIYFNSGQRNLIYAILFTPSKYRKYNHNPTKKVPNLTYETVKFGTFLCCLQTEYCH